VSPAPRYAVYWVPARAHALWGAGCAWLGCDPESAAPPAAAPRERIEAPRRYGFHATLKAPFALRAGCDERALVEAVGTLAGRIERFAMPPLHVAPLAAFLALRPRDEAAALGALGARCVTELDAWRDPEPARERARHATGLDDEQRTLLERWGYAHVLHRWHFHLTLSDAFAPREADAWRAMRRAAEAHFAEALRTPLDATEIALFVEREPRGRFELLRRFALGAR
jgi:hypothetical protein